MNCCRCFYAVLLPTALLALLGCDAASKTAYRANYDSTYQSALEAGKARGKEAGEKEGISEARESAKTGRAWRLYTNLAIWALLAGCIVGIFIQYAILFVCQSNRRLPGPLTFPFIPAIKRSLSYSIFERQFRLMVDFDEQLKKVLAARNLKLAQIQAVHEAVKQRVLAASSIEELTEKRLVEVANHEFSKIITESQKLHEYQVHQVAEATKLENIFRCPHCGRRVKFPTKAANKTIGCPYKNCGRPIRLPPLTSK